MPLEVAKCAVKAEATQEGWCELFGWDGFLFNNNNQKSSISVQSRRK